MYAAQAQATRGVESAGAAAHLVHEHQTLGRGVVENIRGLGHFELKVERRRQIVGGAIG